MFSEDSRMRGISRHTLSVKLRKFMHQAKRISGRFTRKCPRIPEGSQLRIISCFLSQLEGSRAKPARVLLNDPKRNYVGVACDETYPRIAGATSKGMVERIRLYAKLWQNYSIRRNQLNYTGLTVSPRCVRVPDAFRQGSAQLRKGWRGMLCAHATAHINIPLRRGPYIREESAHGGCTEGAYGGALARVMYAPHMQLGRVNISYGLQTRQRASQSDSPL